MTTEPERLADVEIFTLIFPEDEITFVAWEQDGEKIAFIATEDAADDGLMVAAPLDTHLRSCPACQADLIDSLRKLGYTLRFTREQLQPTQ